MAACPSCSSEVPGESRFCPRCGTSLLDATLAPTRTSGAYAPSPAHADDVGRLAPGTLFAGRYRILDFLGRGGMGEVYRAEDLTLRQQVALKFLPEALARDPVRLERFLQEVRTARGVTHPNVCRVHDVGEAEGQRFLSMEFVDGEDLASLLRRIERLPQSKAIEIARQLCAGLAAIHDQGVFHRDLKPANVMIDGKGRARIADFGLAVPAGRSGSEERVGTPLYMAPEQYARGTTSIRSDIYSLGFVLYELFTGKRPFDGSDAATIARLKEESTPTSPSSHVEELDPAVERILLLCLEKDPESRPASALSVSAALPGGDPLAAALAAGETPSPELIAQSGERGGLSTGAAWLVLIALLAGAAGVSALVARRSVVSELSWSHPPQVLADRADKILDRIGYRSPPADEAVGFEYDEGVRDYFESLPSGDQLEAELRAERPPLVNFWYRRAPDVLLPLAFKTRDHLFATVSPDDPSNTTAGMATVFLDTRGRLVELLVVPERDEESRDAKKTPPWPALFEEAGLDFASFTESAPDSIPPVFADTVRAWEGTYPEGTKQSIRVEAASFEGRPVSFRVLGPWTIADRFEPRDTPGGYLALWIATLLASLVFGIRNLLLGRVDRRGAFRLALFIFGLRMGIWILSASHTPRIGDEMQLFLLGAGIALQSAVRYYLSYIAIEPYVRRLWPRVLVSWSRLLSGRVRDPIVGRDILIGGLFGVGWVLVIGGTRMLEAHGGGVASTPGLNVLAGFNLQLTYLLAPGVASVFNGFLLVVLLTLLRVVLRHARIALAGFFLLTIPIFAGLAGNTPVGWLSGALLSASVVFVMMRFGLLAVISTIFFTWILRNAPVTLDLTAWYAAPTIQLLVFITLLAGICFRIALAGRPMLRDPILER